MKTKTKKQSQRKHQFAVKSVRRKQTTPQPPADFGSDGISKAMRCAEKQTRLIREAYELLETFSDISSADSNIRLGWLRRRAAWMKDAK